ncbi:hypothetical protein MP228_007319 [Amoeboaphelidium protococcarum]|nr:hypothetical protein MP228_007319 [Amoeboaphelidium protococcarum]
MKKGAFELVKRPCGKRKFVKCKWVFEVEKASQEEVVKTRLDQQLQDLIKSKEQIIRRHSLLWCRSSLSDCSYQLRVKLAYKQISSNFAMNSLHHLAKVIRVVSIEGVSKLLAVKYQYQSLGLFGRYQYSAVHDIRRDQPPSQFAQTAEQYNQSEYDYASMTTDQRAPIPPTDSTYSNPLISWCQIQVRAISAPFMDSNTAYDYFGKNKRENKDNFPSIFDMSVLGGKKPCKELYTDMYTVQMQARRKSEYLMKYFSRMWRVQVPMQSSSRQSFREAGLGVKVAITGAVTEADTADFLSFKPDKGKGRALVQEDGDSSCLYGLMDSVKEDCKFEFGEDAHRKYWSTSGSQNQENHCIKWTRRRIFQMVILLLKMVFRMILQISHSSFNNFDKNRRIQKEKVCGDVAQAGNIQNWTLTNAIILVVLMLVLVNSCLLNKFNNAKHDFYVFSTSI